MGAGYSEAPLLHRSLKQWPVTYPDYNRRQRARFMMLGLVPTSGRSTGAILVFLRIRRRNLR